MVDYSFIGTQAERVGNPKNIVKTLKGPKTPKCCAMKLNQNLSKYRAMNDGENGSFLYEFL
jgi:hypothetical protein